MPDALGIVQAVVAALLVAAVVTVVTKLFREGPSAGATFAEVLAVGLGLEVGLWWLDLLPSWPPIEDQPRLLFILLPAAALVEILAALTRRRPWLGFVFRLGLSMVTTPLLLLGSGYLPGADASVPSEWTPGQTVAVFLILGIWLAVEWELLIRAARRPGGRVVPAALGLTAAAAGVCVILSANASGGLLGVILAGAAAGVLVTSLLLRTTSELSGLVGLSTFLLFGFLVGGRFFGDLSTINFGLLFIAPAFSCLACLPPLARFKPAARVAATLLLCLIPSGIAAGLAYRNFATSQEGVAGPSMETSLGEPVGSSVPVATPSPRGEAAAPATDPSNGTATPHDPADSVAPPRRAPVDPSEDSKN